MNYLPLIGRFFYSFIFIYFSFDHFSPFAIRYAEAHGAPFAFILVPLSGLMALGGGLCVLFGFRAQFAAWVLIAFLIPVTLIMHNFWAITDPSSLLIQKAMFLKNMSMLGGAFIIAYFGSGPMSIDNKIVFEPQDKIISLEED